MQIKQKANQIIFLIMVGICSHWTVTLSALEKRNSLQIVSEVYKKTPYIRIPPPSIGHKLRFRLLAKVQKIVSPSRTAKSISFRAKWLKCPAALNIKISKKFKFVEKWEGILLLYPKNYRGFVEDPLAETPIPLKYLGVTKGVAFYYYTKDKRKRKDPHLDRLVHLLRLKK